jgi:replication-associated recombination protein RarA
VGGIECLPERLQGTRYYRPGSTGEEAELAKRLEEVLEKRRRKSREREDG